MIPKYMFMREVAKMLNLQPSEITQKSRKLKFRNARLILWSALREAGYSYPAIGDYTGRDHSTVNKLLQTCEPIYRQLGKEVYDKVSAQKIEDKTERYPDLYEVKILKIPDYKQNKIIEKQIVIKKL